MQTPEEINRLPGSSSQLADVYQLGVSILYACTMVSWEELYEMKHKDFEPALIQILENYGPVVYETIK